ncbi:MAG: tRNA (adenosine(37)-N6)-threonylcarbamoyltransferase complex dimerization subunit type 1 TsaB [Herminiimonas sp.]|nr:tRNA (adenosine(37)-N6)-threonylcarbamoyltransferase complex dimerization subunit type 1 TsaB [Herminiimonas sp.]
MPLIIAIETSSELASAALLHDGIVIFRESAGVQSHSHAILPMVQALLAQSGITLSLCDAIAFGSGPGSFTGVRTACGIAQGLAYGLDLPVVPIVTLAAMAQACHEASGASDVLAILDARMDEVYWAHYRYEDGAAHPVVGPSLCAASAVPFIAGALACGNGLPAYAGMFDSRIIAIDSAKVILPHAAHVARLAHAEFLKGHVIAARDAQPLYLRNKVAMTTAERGVKAPRVAV